ncbi:MAG: tRNA uridine-5-carboxymethylaminomethyl(34) synthesis GTPase MnmE [Clostridiales bacterium]|nr:tRNA uridine-5-carboxymethylaminomethyl(34) synthesis GTPase MnmE [Clostridiales bacterium]
MNNDIISAISTANGVGGVAIIRISGSGSLELLSKMFTPIAKNISVLNFEPYKLYVGEIDCNDFKDFGMAVYFKAPKSYTGEDMVEIHCHGGITITQAVLKKTFELGSEPATRGEFTKRAFLNGKLSLSSAEGLIDMINGESVAQVKSGYSLYREKLFQKVNDMQNGLTYALAEIGADIDYPEEDLEELALDTLEKNLTMVKDEITLLISGYNAGSKIKNGVKVAIVGRPNTGKSSILNRLLNYDKAIVSSIEGTTRDVVEGSIEIDGVKFDFFDTAGIRTSTDEIEMLGIERSKKIINSSDVCLAVFDGGNEFTKEDQEILDSVKDFNHVIVFNKKDTYKDTKNGVEVSAKTGEGLEELKRELFNKSFSQGVDRNAELITEERHLFALKKALEFANSAINGIKLNVPLDIVSEDVKYCWSALGEITGKTASEEIIDEIFAKFCVGK